MKQTLSIVITILLTATVVGGVIYFWQNERYQTLLHARQTINSQINTQTTATTTNALTTQIVNIYFVALEDNGATGQLIGCGDSVVPVTKTITVDSSATEDAISAALTLLFDYKTVSVEDDAYYNALYQSSLQVDDVAISNDVAIVKLSGQYALGGECDNPRFQAQIEQTILQFPNITSTQVTIGGRSLEDIVSLH